MNFNLDDIGIEQVNFDRLNIREGDEREETCPITNETYLVIPIIITRRNGMDLRKYGRRLTLLIRKEISYLKEGEDGEMVRLTEKPIDKIRQKFNLTQSR